MARILAGVAESEFAKMGSRLMRGAASQSTNWEEPAHTEVSTSELFRTKMLKALQAKMAEVESRNKRLAAEAGLDDPAHGSITRQMVDNWKTLAQEAGESFAGQYGAREALQEKMDSHSIHFQDLHQAYAEDLGAIRAMLMEKESGLADQVAEMQRRHEERVLVYQGEINELKDTTVSLAKQNAKFTTVYPVLSEASGPFLEYKEKKLRHGKEFNYLKHRLNAFVAIVGDLPINNYNIHHLSEFADNLSYIPANYSVKPKWRGMAITQIIAKIREEGTKEKRLTTKTIKVNYVGKIKTAFRYICAAHQIRSPFKDADPIIGESEAPSVDRAPLSIDKANRLLAVCARSHRSDERFLPLLAILTGARLAELVFLQGRDIKCVDGHYVADLGSPIITRDGSTRRPLKNATSSRIIALHDGLRNTGFLEWVKVREDGFLFPELHTDKVIRPANAASKRFQRIFRKLEIHQNHSQVFHSLRHQYKDIVRSKQIPDRTLDLQTGHALPTIGQKYGSKVLRDDEVSQLAKVVLPKGLDLSPYEKSRADLPIFLEGPRSKARLAGLALPYRPVVSLIASKSRELSE